MKGQVAMIASMVALVVIIAILMSVLGGIKPNRQIAMANAQQLALAINDVCLSGTPKMINFSFPQTEPETFGGMLPGVLPRLAIKSEGDPNYLIYYEHFPIAEGVGWEALASLGKRIVWPIAGSNIDNVYSLFAAMDWLNHSQGVEGAPIIVPNIILGQNNMTGDIGVWQGNYYKFLRSMSSLSSLEKSAIKYRSCGENSLCFKMPDGIIRMPLSSNCQIDYIGIEAGRMGGFLGVFERSDFYIVSPCQAELLIEKTSCECNDLEAWSPVSILYPASEQESSTKWPIYSIENGLFVKKKEHISCAHRWRESGEKAVSLNFVEENEINNCISIHFSEYSGYCFTHDKDSRLLELMAVAGIVTGDGVLMNWKNALSNANNFKKLNSLKQTIQENKGLERIGRGVPKEWMDDLKSRTRIERLKAWSAVGKEMLAGVLKSLLVGIVVTVGANYFMTIPQPVKDFASVDPRGLIILDEKNLTIGLGDLENALWLWP
jgi:hypothetical protein